MGEAATVGELRVVEFPALVQKIENMLVSRRRLTTV
jgi:hypothetical protein